MTSAKSWFQENHTLAYFLLAQLIAVATGAAAILAYAVKLETRVHIMETRGAEYTVDRMNKFDQRITVLEQHIKHNEHSIQRIVEVMTRELGKPVQIPPPPR